MNSKWCLEPFVPPILWEAARRIRALLPRSEWEYVPAGWNSTDSRIKGWNVASVVKAQRAKWPEFMRLMSGTGPLGVAHESWCPSEQNHSAHNTHMSFAYVLALAAQQGVRVSMLDWGCGLGHYYVIGKALLPGVSFEYCGKDLPLICEAARVALPEATFCDDEVTCFARTYDLVMASTSLQYMEHWRETVRKLAGVCRRYLYLARVPIVNRVPSFVVVQRPHSYGYDTEYLCWYFNRSEFLDHMKSIGLELVREFINFDRVIVRGAPENGEYRNFLFRAQSLVDRG